MKLKTLLLLGRTSNLPTVWSNMLAGAVLSGAVFGANSLAALLLSVAMPAAAEEPEPDFAPAKALLDAGQFDEAAASYQRIAEQYAARYQRSEQQRYYCSGGGAETLLYLTTAMVDGASAVVVVDQKFCISSVLRYRTVGSAFPAQSSIGAVGVHARWSLVLSAWRSGCSGLAGGKPSVSVGKPPSGLASASCR